MCFAYHSDGPTWYDTAEVKARKPHSCCECDEPIKPGDTYIRTVGVWGGDFWQFKQCDRCVRLIAAVVKSEHDAGCDRTESAPAYGNLFVDIDRREWRRYADDFRRLGLDDAVALIPAELLEAVEDAQ